MGVNVLEEVYQPMMDGGCELQADIRVDSSFIPILEDITHELFTDEVHTSVQESAPTGVVSDEAQPTAGEVPDQVVQDDVYCPSFEYVPDGCHLHNEGCESDDEDDEDGVGHFISLASMCRDEQLFTSYYQSLCQRQPEQQRSADADTEQEGTGELNGEGNGGAKKRRKYSPVVE